MFAGISGIAPPYSLVNASPVKIHSYQAVCILLQPGITLDISRGMFIGNDILISCHYKCAYKVASVVQCCFGKFDGCFISSS
jgi:hypothetical protein